MTPWRKIQFYIRAPLVGIWFLFSSFVGILAVAVKPDTSNGARFSHLASFLALPLFGIKLKIHHRERLKAYQPCIYVTNHQANEDVFFNGAVYPSRTVVTGKRELIRIPIFGPMFKAMGNIMIDRGKQAAALAQLKEAAQRINKECLSVWIFPEGHRNNSDRLLPFKRGGFYMAVIAQVPVVPVATQRYRHLLDIPGRRMLPGTIHIEVLEAIPTAGMTEADVPALAARAQAAVEASLTRMDQEHR